MENILMTEQANDVKITAWLESVMHDMQVEKLKHESNVLDEKIKNLYSELASGELKTITSIMQSQANDYYRKNITIGFLDKVLNNSTIDLTKLGVNYSQNSVLIWAEINDNDTNSERELILLKAELNAKYSSLGYRTSITIVENSDNLSIPTNYQHLTF
jgi:hypothetical protein